MSQFTSNAALYPFKAKDSGKWEWVLSEPLIWEVRGAGQGFTITVPTLFSTDLGSIPWWGRILFNPGDPQAAKAYVLHDFLLQEFGATCQPFAAAQLYEALRALEVPTWRRKLQVAGVVAGIDDW